MKVQFITSAEKPADFPVWSRPEVAVCGRSNVGKSSLINHLVEQKIAKTSQSPGKTRLINFFDIGSFCLVDLPGFGFAAVSKKERAGWGELVEAYLETRDNLKAVILLIDVTREPMEEIALYQWLQERGVEVIIVITKCDRATQSELYHGLALIAKRLSLPAESLIRFSIKDPKCRIKLLSELQKNL